MDYKPTIKIPGIILGKIGSFIKGIVSESIINLIHPLAAFNTVFVIIGFLISSGFVFNNYNFILPLLSGPVFGSLLAMTVPLVVLFYLDRLAGYNKSIRRIGVCGLAISGTYVFVFSYVMGLVSLWGAIYIAETGDVAARPALMTFSFWTLVMNWFLKEQIKGIDGRSGAINQCARFLYRKYPKLQEYDDKFVAWQVVLIRKIRK